MSFFVYCLSCDQRGGSVPRRYSEFVFLWECLTRRYPFRLFPALPPKRIGGAFSSLSVDPYLTSIPADEQFLEQRKYASDIPGLDHQLIEEEH